MKTLLALSAGVLAFGLATTTMTPAADANGYRDRKAKSKTYKSRRRVRAEHRDDDLCFGSRSKMLSDLDFRRGCEVEEFWRRIEDLGDRR